MRVLAYLPVILFAGSLYANSQAPAPKVTAPAPAQKKGREFYMGLGGGYQQFGGKKALFALGDDPTLNLMRKKKIRQNTAGVEALLGTAYEAPGSKFAVGVEANLNLSSLRSRDRNTYLVEGITPNTITTKWESKYALGLDVKPAYLINEKQSVYALLGADFRKYRFSLTDDDGVNKFHKNVFGFSWGAGYEYKMGASSVGLRYRNSLAKKSFHKNIGGPYKLRLNPNLHSLMITYRYSFKR